MTTMDQNAPGKIAVRPRILKYAATAASEREEIKIRYANIISNSYTHCGG